jgi:hypothetical protein
MSKIFVQIASYRDPELVPTIRDLIAKAKYPENLTFGICWQRDETESLEEFTNDPRFRVMDVAYHKSEGLGWARNITQKFWKDEFYTLQIDSHHRFVQDWDMMCIDDYNQSLEFSKKPIITTYCTPFNPKDDYSIWNPTPCLMSQYEFSHDKLLMSMPWSIQDYKSRTKVIRARTLSGHFIFTQGKFCEEVQYDPRVYFGGYTEETSMSLRAYSHGYDFFSPYRMIMWHEYTRNYRVKHWEDHGHKTEQIKVTSGERDVVSRNLVRQLFGQENHNIPFGIYGLGTERTLRDYEVAFGFDFKKCRIQDYTLKVKDAPNPTDWENQFIKTKFDLVCDWDLEFFKVLDFKKPKFLTFAVQNKNGEELLRKDFTIENEPQYVNLENGKYSVNLETTDKPNKIVMFLFDEEKQWSPRYEKQL